MPSRDRNIVNGLYDITNLTWRNLIGAASIPAAVKFFVLKLPRPSLRVGRRETMCTHASIHQAKHKTKSTFEQLPSLMNLGG